MITNNNLTIDNSHLAQGYLIVGAKIPYKVKTKIQVQKGEHILNYDLSAQTIQIPLQLGGGQYRISLYRNIASNRYQLGGTATVYLQEKYASAYLLSSSIYVECNKVKLSFSNFEAIRAYIKNTYIYDFIRALQVKKGMMPDITYCLTNHRGICQDLAALATAICRNSGFPARLIIGRADKQLHAWVEVTVEDKKILFDPTSDCLKQKLAKKYIEERWY